VEGKKMNPQVTKCVGIVLLVAGFAMLAFSMWQLNMLTSPFVDGSIGQSVNYFKSIEEKGFSSFRQVPWTINMYFFPNMTAGEAYDYLMIMNFTSAIPLMMGVYLLFVRNRQRVSASNTPPKQ
jgi:hypothetical protein